MTLLPAFLGVAGHWINRLSVHRRGRSGEADSDVSVSPRWERWGRHVSANAWPYATGTSALLFLLSAPVLGSRLGFPDEGNQPETNTQRRAYDLVAEGFGPGFNRPLLIAVELGGGSGGESGVVRDETLVQDLVAAVEADPGIMSVSGAAVDQVSQIATFLAYPTTTPEADATVQTVDRLRTAVFPDVLGEGESRAHVGGQTAIASDIAGRVADRLPLFVGAVIVLAWPVRPGLSPPRPSSWSRYSAASS